MQAFFAGKTERKTKTIGPAETECNKKKKKKKEYGKKHLHFTI